MATVGEEEISFSREEADMLFGRFGARMASLGICYPRVGKCAGNYSSSAFICSVCRKTGAFLGIQFKEESCPD